MKEFVNELMASSEDVRKAIKQGLELFEGASYALQIELWKGYNIELGGDCLPYADTNDTEGALGEVPSYALAEALEQSTHYCKDDPYAYWKDGSLYSATLAQAAGLAHPFLLGCRLSYFLKWVDDFARADIEKLEQLYLKAYRERN